MPSTITKPWENPTGSWKLSGEYNILTYEKKSEGDPSASIITPGVSQKRLLPCDMSKDAFFIDPFCDVIPCNGMAKKAVMGNLKESPDWDTLWNSEQAKTVRAQTKQCDRNCWMIGSVSPAMHKYIWVPGWWVVKHKFLKGGKYSLSENAFIPEAQKK